MLQKIRRNNLVLFCIFYFLPVLITCIINIGVICKIPYNYSFLEEQIYFLSDLSINPPIINLLIGSITAFAIFFSIAPLGFSIKAIHPSLVKKYIFHNPVTIAYATLEFSIISIIGYFSLWTELHNLNYFLSVVYLILSIAFSVRYFYWVLKTIVPKNLITLIVENINLDQFSKYDKKYQSIKSSFLKQAKNSNLTVLFPPNDISSLLSKKYYRIREMTEGSLEEIDFSILEQELLSSKNDISRIGIHVEIGAMYPDSRFRQLPNYNPQTELITIEFNEGTSPERLVTLNEELIEKRNSIIRAFNFNRNNEAFISFHHLIDDCFEILEPKNISDDQVAIDLIKNLQTIFLKQNILDYSDQVLDITYSQEKIVLILIDKIKELLTNNQNEIIYDEVLTLVYDIKKWAVEGRSLSVMMRLLSLTESYFFNLLAKSKYYSPTLSSYFLNLREIFISLELRKKLESGSSEKVEKYIEEFYQPLVTQSLQGIARMYSFFLDYFYLRPPEEMQKYINYNSQFYLEILHNIYFLDKFDYAKEMVGASIELHAKYLMNIAILTFWKIMRDDLPRRILKSEFLDPLILNINTIKKYSLVDIKDFYSHFMFDNDYSDPRQCPDTDWFRKDKIHESGVHSPQYYDFSEFWVYAALIHKINGLPFKIVQTDDVITSNKVIIRALISASSKSAILGLICYEKDITKETMKDHINQYRIYLLSLINGDI